MFMDTNKYDFSLIGTKNSFNFTEYIYSFIGKLDIEYKVILLVFDDNSAKIEFSTMENANNQNLFTELTNANDVQGVMNTLKSIILSHENLEILRVHCDENRIDFYKSIFDYHNKENHYNDLQKFIEVKLK